jgi:hypothetical protein
MCIIPDCRSDLKWNIFGTEGFFDVFLLDMELSILDCNLHMAWYKDSSRGLFARFDTNFHGWFLVRLSIRVLISLSR